MNTTTPHTTAKIFVFPRRPPPSPGGPIRHEVSPVIELHVPRMLAVEFGSGWYHEAALKDADRTFKS